MITAMPAFWTLLPFKLVAIAGVVYALVATLKLIFPALTGWRSMALNIGLSLTGVLAVAKPGDLATVQFWTALMLTVASAAGIHGTVKQATALPDPAPPPPRSPGLGSSLVMMLFLAGAAACAGCAITAATPTAPATLAPGAVDAVDQAAYLTLRPAHDFAASISSDIQTGKLAASPAARAAMDKFNHALNLADAAEQSYHAGGGGNVAALNSAVAAVLTAWSSVSTALTPSI